MRSPTPRRIALVPVSGDDAHVPGAGKVRRYALARGKDRAFSRRRHGITPV